jgi:hypothetical protein
MRKNFNKYDSYLPLLLFCFSVILILLTIHHPFYWDNVVQISVPANWYYQTNFRYFFLPDNIATGHPTFVGMYFAILWKIFGRSLTVCHLGMFPFVFGLILQIWYFLKKIKAGNLITMLIIIGFVLADATFLSQLSLITFDVIQLFFFFLCINLMLSNRNKAFALSYSILVLISLRASIIAGGILISGFLYDRYCLHKEFKIKDYLKYLPGIISLFLFLIFFRISKGWVVHNTVSNEWPDAGKFASFYRMIWNSFIIGWRLIDYGRIGLVIFFVIFIVKTIYNRKFQDETLKILFFIIFGQFILIVAILITSQIPLGHRYLLPVIIPSVILTVYWMRNFLKYSTIWLTFVFVVLVSGHYWIYPMKVSQGWESNTRHWKYFNVSEKMHAYINEAKIDKKKIGTFSPNKFSRFLTHIEADTGDIYSGVPFKSKYILYSNAFNVKPEVIDSLFLPESNWELIKKYSDNRISASLYRKKD